MEVVALVYFIHYVQQCPRKLGPFSAETNELMNAIDLIIRVISAIEMYERFVAKFAITVEHLSQGTSIPPIGITFVLVRVNGHKSNNTRMRNGHRHRLILVLKFCQVRPALLVVGEFSGKVPVPLNPSGSFNANFTNGGISTSFDNVVTLKDSCRWWNGNQMSHSCMVLLSSLV